MFEYCFHHCCCKLICEQTYLFLISSKYSVHIFDDIAITAVLLCIYFLKV